MRQKRLLRRGARCAAIEMPDWRALLLSAALGALVLAHHL